MLRHTQELSVLRVQQEEYTEQSVQDAWAAHHKHCVQDIYHLVNNNVYCVWNLGRLVANTGNSLFSNLNFYNFFLKSNLLELFLYLILK